LYPHLYCMALNYLSIPATSVNVKCLFSHGCLILSHTHAWLSAQSTCALLCLGIWSGLGLIKDEDIKKVIALPDIEGDNEVNLADGWDRIDQHFN
ncbi:hypothetical protein PAXRUDRAFT_166211, partial [Paxillus rubicundulus Ve08.2h10]